MGKSSKNKTMKTILSTAAVLTCLGWAGSVQAISITSNSSSARAATAITTWAGNGVSAFSQAGFNAAAPVTGLGILRQPGFDHMVATWAFSSQMRAVTVIVPASAGRVTLAAPQALPASLPDGGTTAMLLGASVSGLVFIRRKLTV